MSIPVPNYTQSPNVIFDYWMSILNGTEFKVLCVLCRKIFGFHKGQFRDRISLSQMEKMTGVGRQALWKAIDRLESLGLCSKFVGGTSGQQITVYELVVSNNCNQGENHPTPRVKITPTKENLQNKETETFRAREEIPKKAESDPAQQKKKYSRADREIPHCLKKYPKALPVEEQQKLANQFSEAVLVEAMKDAISFSRKIAPIDKLPAWLTDRCRKIIAKQKEGKK